MNPGPPSLVATSLFETGGCFSSERPVLIEQAPCDSNVIERKGVSRTPRVRSIWNDAGVQRPIDGLAHLIFTAVTT